MKSVCVFCGSSDGSKPDFTALGRELGIILAQQHIRLIYGGAKIGVMGAVAQSCLDHGGEVIGVIPTLLKKREVFHPNLTELLEVTTMHERKALMMNHSDAFIALPGGIGTMEELFEVLTWRQLHIHQKPIGILDTQEFYSPFLQLMQSFETFGFVRPSPFPLFDYDTSPEKLLNTLSKHISTFDSNSTHSELL